ncbi:MAG TPA: hypothetical protein VIL17_05410 [Coriobacteriia bacterium]
MKRFAVIVTLSFLVVFMTTGSAFALVCNGCGCSDSRNAATTSCAASRSTGSCAMGDGQTMQQSSCGHDTQAQSRESVSVEPSHSPAAVVVGPIVLRPALILQGLVRSHYAPDARGAPHLSAVMRN